MNWQPTCTIETLKARAKLLADIRQFFAARDVLEVETPLLMEHGVTDRYMRSMRVAGAFAGDKDKNKDKANFLQTSPEYAMKRLLAAGSGSIYQLGKAFRLEESGRRHNPEFSMLEWYRVGFDHQTLMAEVYGLLQKILGSRGRHDYSYQAVFQEKLGIDPLLISDWELEDFAIAILGNLPMDLEREDYLSLLFEAKIEPSLGKKKITFIHSYPASQASLARLDEANPQVANRFEVYVDGFELANGFYELADPQLQYQRFEADNAWRQENGLEMIEIDPKFMAALESGLPDCAGVALGVDRLLMIQQNIADIRQVLTFPQT